MDVLCKYLQSRFGRKVEITTSLSIFEIPDRPRFTPTVIGRTVNVIF